MAPAPSGFLHLGNMRTFLFDHLYSQGQDGTLILRIEDTDADRSSPEADAHIVDSLRWLGIRWQEGPDIGGPFGPYRQSERNASHRKAAESLLTTGHAYECYCTEAELAQERRDQESRGEAPRYSGRCYRLSDSDRQALRDEGRRPSIRFHVPAQQAIEWDDLVYGRISYQSDDIGDFVILRANGSPIYNLANVVDDHDMRVTVALRGQAHIPNTPRQIMLYRDLDWNAPRFAHVPDVLDQQGRKLGKRFGAKGITEYRDEGYLAQALVNYMALLGWSPPSGEEFMSMDDLCRMFAFDRVQKSNATFDPVRLEWFNGQYIRRTSIDELVDLAAPFIRQAGLIEGDLTPEDRSLLRAILPLVQERVRTLAAIPAMVEFFYRDAKPSPEALAVKRRSQGEVKFALSRSAAQLSSLECWSASTILESLSAVAQEIEWKRGDLLMAVRVAETGRTVTPPLTESMEILGKERSVARIQAAEAAL